MKWELVLFLAAAIQGLILSSIFLSDYQNRRKFFLGLYLFLFSITILHYVNYWSKAFSLPFFVQFLVIIPTWLMPFAFYYFLKDKVSFSHLKYHLLPPALFTIYLFLEPILIPKEFYLIAAEVSSYTLIALFLTYFIFLIRSQSAVKHKNLFLLVYASFLVGYIMYTITTLTNTYSLRWDYINCAAFVLLTYGVTYFAEFNYLKERVQPKYSSSSLTREEGEYLVKKINKVLLENKYYVEPDFSLSTFAAKLGVPKYRISQALNVYSQKSFTELVNQLRIEEAKKKLKDESATYLKLESIGEEVGFRNKVSFYSNFKKLEGKSPGEYRDEHHR